MKKLLILVVLAAAGYLYFGYRTPTAPAAAPAATPAAETRKASADAVFADAYANRRNNLPVSGEGTVVRLLSDDNTGNRHQRFIVKLASGQTLLIAHNIDIAPRVAALNIGDRIAFSGEYAWNEKGGVVHWTHRTTSGSHPAGSITHNGQTYQ